MLIGVFSLSWLCSSGFVSMYVKIFEIMLETSGVEFRWRNFEQVLAGDYLYGRLKGRSCVSIWLSGLASGKGSM